MTEIPDGPPVDMSKVTLGKRYSSEDMYRENPDMRPDGWVAFDLGAVTYTDQIDGVTIKEGPTSGR